MAPSLAPKGAASSARRVGCFSGCFFSPSRAHNGLCPPHNVVATLVYAGNQMPQGDKVEQAPFAPPLQLDTAPVADAVGVETDKLPAAFPGAPAAGQAEEVVDLGGETEVPEHGVVPELQDEEASTKSSSSPAAEAATNGRSITLSVHSYHSYQELMKGEICREMFGATGESGPLSSQGHSAQNTHVQVSPSSQASSRRILAGNVPPPRAHSPVGCRVRNPRSLLASSPRPRQKAKENLSLIGRIDSDLQQLLESDLVHQESCELQRRRSCRAAQVEMILL